MPGSIILKVTVDPHLKDDDVLRRYLDMARFLSQVSSRKIYLCRGDLFQDKFEGSFTPSLKRKIEISYAQQEIDFSYEKFKKDLREGVFVSCWSLGADDNMALWRLYGSTTNSVAITTTVGRLREAMEAFQTPGHQFLQRVKYSKHWRDPALNVRPYSRIFEYKVIGYKFEGEVRLILDHVGHPFRAEDKSEGVLLPVDLNKFIRSIVVAPESSAWFKHVVEDVTRKYEIKVDVKTSKLAMDPI